MNFSATFPEPKSLEELQERRARVTEELLTIQAQLSQRNRVDDEGKRLTGQAYHRWRDGALAAAAVKQKQLQTFKAWERQYRQQHPEKKAAEAPPVGRYFPKEFSSDNLPNIEEELLDLCMQVENVFERSGATRGKDYSRATVVNVAASLMAGIDLEHAHLLRSLTKKEAE